MRRAAILILAAGVLSGCATQPLSDAKTSPVPRDRILLPSYLEALPDTGVVAVKRDSGLLGSGCPLQFLVDTQPVANLKSSERVVLHVPVGDHVLSVRPTGGGLCRLGTGLYEVQASITSTSQLSYRIGVGVGGDLVINPTRF
jgi:hypothetical protein